MRKGDCVSVQITDEQHELFAGVLREFMGGLTQKILGPAAPVPEPGSPPLIGSLAI
jgi:hypothetical protein